MARWPDWSLGIPEEIARFVVPREAVRLGLRPRGVGDLHDDPEAVSRSIYDGLRARELGYTSTVLGDTGTQSIQTPEQVLRHGSPNCVDLSVLFAGICLACDLVPLVVLVTKADNTRHALVVVVPRARPRARTSFDLGPVGGSGRLERTGPEACAELVAVAATQEWIPIETTGVCRSRQWSAGSGPPASLEFDEAVAAAHRVLGGARRIDVIDVHRLQSEGLAPHRPRSPIPRPAIAVPVALVVVLAIVAGVVWNGDPSSPVTDEPMGGEFNIAIAHLDGGDALGDEARGLARQLADAVSVPFEESRRFEVRGPDEVGVVPAADVATRADAIRADVLVHGILSTFPGLEDQFVADFSVYTSRHTGATPFPLTFDESFVATVSSAAIRADTATSETAIRAFVLVLDGLAALLADQYEIAEERLDEAATLVAPATGPDPLVLSLQAWTLLVRASVEQHAAEVERARDLAGQAVRLDPDSEFAILTELSASFLEISEPGPTHAVLTCGPTDAELPRPDLDAVRALADRVATTVADLSPLGRIQGASLIGRLEVTEQFGRRAAGEGIDLTDAVATFEGILADIEQAGDPTVLQIWKSDAHRWLGRLTQTGDTPAQVSADHFLAAATTATPLWRSRDFALAGHAHRCRPGGSDVAAVCLFEDAARIAVGLDPEEVSSFRRAADEIDAECPPGRTPATS